MSITKDSAYSFLGLHIDPRILCRQLLAATFLGRAQDFLQGN